MIFRWNNCLWAIFLLLLSSCGSDRLEQALRLSGDNRPELESVLAHYRQSGDREAMRAAEFLIAGMPGHCSLSGSGMSDYIAAIDTMYPTMTNAVKRVVWQIPGQKGKNVDYPATEDVQSLTAEFLISHIDDRLAQWRSCRWLQDCCFEDFCEYLLPYRVGCEPLPAALDSSDRYWRELSSWTNRYSHVQTSSSELRQALRAIVGKRDEPFMPYLTLPDGRSYTFECEDNCMYDVATMRGAGIPSTIDYVPFWPTRSSSHYWRVLFDAQCLHGVSHDTHYPRAAKVLRRTWSRHRTPRPGKGEYIPETFLNPFTEDVTSQYVEVMDVSARCPLGVRHAYLAVFNDRTWKPVSCARVHLGRARFRDMGRGAVYLLVAFSGDKMYSLGRPFLLDNRGRKRDYIPSSVCQTIAMTRKYPLTYAKTRWADALTGCRVEAARDASFEDALAVYEFSEANPDLNYNVISVPDSLASYRNWRLVSPGRAQVGELSLHDASGARLDGQRLWSASEDTSSVRSLFDGDALSYATLREWAGVSLPLSPSAKVAFVHCISRTDANGIVPGDVYELMYFDHTWISAGRQTATCDSLVFKAPAGALYWLRNLSEGREERIFTYENGRQIWW